METPKVADVGRADPPDEPTHIKAHRNKKVYPPHLQVRRTGDWGFYVKVHGIPQLNCWISYDHWVDRKDLPSIIQWFEGRYPETCELPVRFVNCAPIECGREIISN
jgi:hypothetical protein